jgi:UDP-glucose 4-epimerase
MTFVKNRIGSPRKAENEICFKAQVGLQEGLERLISWRNSHKEEVAERRRAAGIANE